MNTVAGSALGTVKFFNTKKNFGFVATDNGDIYIGQQAAGKRADMLVPGMTVNVTYLTADKGLIASSIGFRRYRGKVKWYSAKKGFGFVVCDELGGQDVFLHTTKLKVEVSAIETGMEVEFLLVKDDDGRFSAYDAMVRPATAKAA